MLSAELDYTIEIPDQACGIQENSEGGKEAGTRQPLVILLGWGGCSDKNLAKYSAIYHKRGCIVIRYTAPWHMVFFSESLGIPSLRVLAQKLLELLFDYEIEKEPLLFHVFSNAGVMLYRYVLELLQNHRRFCHLRVVGTIFDSGPGDNNLVFCMASCLLLSPLLVDGISVGIERQLILWSVWAAQVLTRLGCHLQCITRG
uniref:Transmembrane protein 53 n=1 Tax=Rhinolophus ferrumequinum TaxID=59479 RepID=A0A671EK62_RHIFE